MATQSYPGDVVSDGSKTFTLEDGQPALQMPVHAQYVAENGCFVSARLMLPEGVNLAADWEITRDGQEFHHGYNTGTAGVFVWIAEIYAPGDNTGWALVDIDGKKQILRGNWTFKQLPTLAETKEKAELPRDESQTPKGTLAKMAAVLRGHKSRNTVPWTGTGRKVASGEHYRFKDVVSGPAALAGPQDAKNDELEAVPEGKAPEVTPTRPDSTLVFEKGMQRTVDLVKDRGPKFDTSVIPLTPNPTDPAELAKLLTLEEGMEPLPRTAGDVVVGVKGKELNELKQLPSELSKQIDMNVTLHNRNSSLHKKIYDLRQIIAAFENNDRKPAETLKGDVLLDLNIALKKEVETLRANNFALHDTNTVVHKTIHDLLHGKLDSDALYALRKEYGAKAPAHDVELERLRDINHDLNRTNMALHEKAYRASTPAEDLYAMAPTELQKVAQLRGYNTELADKNIAQRAKMDALKVEHDTAIERLQERCKVLVGEIKHARSSNDDRMTEAHGKYLKVRQDMKDLHSEHEKYVADLRQEHADHVKGLEDEIKSNVVRVENLRREQCVDVTKMRVESDDELKRRAGRISLLNSVLDKSKETITLLNRSVKRKNEEIDTLKQDRIRDANKIREYYQEQIATRNDKLASLHTKSRDDDDQLEKKANKMGELRAEHREVMRAHDEEFARLTDKISSLDIRVTANAGSAALYIERGNKIAELRKELDATVSELTDHEEEEERLIANTHELKRQLKDCQGAKMTVQRTLDGFRKASSDHALRAALAEKLLAENNSFEVDARHWRAFQASLKTQVKGGDDQYRYLNLQGQDLGPKKGPVTTGFDKEPVYDKWGDMSKDPDEEVVKLEYVDEDDIGVTPQPPTFMWGILKSDAVVASKTKVTAVKWFSTQEEALKAHEKLRLEADAALITDAQKRQDELELPKNISPGAAAQQRSVQSLANLLKSRGYTESHVTAVVKSIANANKVMDKITPDMPMPEKVEPRFVVEEDATASELLVYDTQEDDWYGVTRCAALLNEYHDRDCCGAFDAS